MVILTTSKQEQVDTPDPCTPRTCDRVRGSDRSYFPSREGHMNVNGRWRSTSVGTSERRDALSAGACPKNQLAARAQTSTWMRPGRWPSFVEEHRDVSLTTEPRHSRKHASVTHFAQSPCSLWRSRTRSLSLTSSDVLSTGQHKSPRKPVNSSLVLELPEPTSERRDNAMLILLNSQSQRLVPPHEMLRVRSIVPTI